MRHVNAPTVVIWLLALSGPIAAQGLADVRHVSTDRAEVRSGPSESSEFYITNHLVKGVAVEVTAERPGGWLEIKPPRGSFSYINIRFLKHIHPELPNHVVTLQGVKVPVYMGSEVNARRPTVVGVWLEPGAQVVSRGPVKTDADGGWMPIDAPARERRFIRATAVVKSDSTGGAVVRGVSSGETVQTAFASPGGPLAVSEAPSANPPPSPDILWRQAEQAERAGKISEAITLYTRIAHETSQTFPFVSGQALQRAYYLRNGYRGYGVNGNVAVPPVMPTVKPSTVRTMATPVSSNGNNVTNAGLVTTTTLQRDTSSFTPQAPIQMPGATVPNPPRGTPSQWAGYKGVLRKAGRMVEGVTTYTLDDPITLRPVLYAVPGQGINLGAYLNRPVQLWGYAVYRGDLRSNFMTASRVVPEQ